jgi:hypothetical protein
MLHVIYRSYGGENAKGRPAFYDKTIALVSLLRAVSELEGAGEIVFVNDGPIPDERLRLMERSGEVVARSQLGMRGSLRAALALPAERGWAEDDLVWIAEDDYLYRPNAFTGLSAAATAFPDAAYFALYAVIGNRLPNGAAPDDKHVPDGCTSIPAGWQGSEPLLVDGHPWRRALSTTSTFGARVGPLEEDRLMMFAAMWSGGAWDYTTCLLYQGLRPYTLASVMQFQREMNGLKDGARRAAISAIRIGLHGYQAARALAGRSGRLFVAPDPALATHLESAYLAVGTDWSALAEHTARWGTERSLI